MAKAEGSKGTKTNRECTRIDANQEQPQMTQIYADNGGGNLIAAKTCRAVLSAIVLGIRDDGGRLGEGGRHKKRKKGPNENENGL